jgi:exportin-2 (importin alpha re-exporter)
MLSLTINILQNDNLDDNMFIIVTMLMQIFYNLNYQDLHPKFEDNIGNWMPILKKVMNYANTSEFAFKCKGAAVEAILLYATRYKEDVEESIKGFSSEIW